MDWCVVRERMQTVQETPFQGGIYTLVKESETADPAEETTSRRVEGGKKESEA